MQPAIVALMACSVQLRRIVFFAPGKKQFFLIDNSGHHRWSRGSRKEAAKASTVKESPEDANGNACGPVVWIVSRAFCWREPHSSWADLQVTA